MVEIERGGAFKKYKLKEERKKIMVRHIGFLRDWIRIKNGTLGPIYKTSKILGDGGKLSRADIRVSAKSPGQVPQRR